MCKKEIRNRQGLKIVIDGITDTKFRGSEVLTVGGGDLMAFPLQIHKPIPKSVAKSVSTFYSTHTSTILPIQQPICPH